MNKYKIPVIGKMIEHREADKKADALLKKYDFYKTEDSMQVTLDRRMNAYRRNREKMNSIKAFFSYCKRYTKFHR